MFVMSFLVLARLSIAFAVTLALDMIFAVMSASSLNFLKCSCTMSLIMLSMTAVSPFIEASSVDDW